MWNEIARTKESWPEHCLKNVLPIEYVRLNSTTMWKEFGYLKLENWNLKLKIKYICCSQTVIGETFVWLELWFSAAVWPKFQKIINNSIICMWTESKLVSGDPLSALWMNVKFCKWAMAWHNYIWHVQTQRAFMWVWLQCLFICNLLS